MQDNHAGSKVLGYCAYVPVCLRWSAFRRCCLQESSTTQSGHCTHRSTGIWVQWQCLGSNDGRLIDLGTAEIVHACLSAFGHCCPWESSSARRCGCICTLVNLLLLSTSTSTRQTTALCILLDFYFVIMHAYCCSCIPMHATVDCISEHYRQNWNSNPTLHDYLPSFLLAIRD